VGVQDRFDEAGFVLEAALHTHSDSS
jgi:hypothetical protein